MAPSSHRRKSGRRPRLEKPSVSSGDTPAKRRRVEIDVIEGVKVFSFRNELDLEYFTNIEEPLPRKTRPFRGFYEDDYETLCLNRIKSCFELFVMKNNENVLRNDRKKGVEFSQCPPATSSATVVDDLIVLSDDESNLEPTAVPHVAPGKRVDSDDEPVLFSQPPDIITIDSDDSDDDVVMVSDPNAPVPLPVRACVCPNCGKVKRTDQNRRVAESDKDSGIDGSVVIDELATTDEDVTAATAPVRRETTPLQPQDLPPKATTPAQSVEMSEEVAAQPADVLAEVSAPAAANVVTELPSSVAAEPPIVSSSRSPLKEGNSSRSPSKLSAKIPNHPPPKVQKPSSPPKLPAPKTLRVVSKESGKTFFLTINGAKSKILKPSTPPSTLCNSSKHPLSFHYLRPGEKPCDEVSSETKTVMPVPDPPPNGPRTVDSVRIQQLNLIPKSVGPLTPEVGQLERPNGTPRSLRVTIPPNTMRVTLPPGFSGKNTVARAQHIDGTKGPTQVEKLVVAKPGTVIADSPSQASTVILPPQSLVKQQEAVPNVQKADVASSVLKSTCLGGNDSDFVEVDSPTRDKVRSPNNEASSDHLFLEDDTKSVVKDLIDFVCRQEAFPLSYHCDQDRTEQFCKDVPCRQLRCRMGCICVSLAKKNVRRVRCKNAGCIFGCICASHGVTVPMSRHAKTVPNVRILGYSRRKQVLTVLTDFDADGVGAQTALKSFLPVQKVAGSRSVSVSRGPNPDIGLQGSGSSNLSASKGTLSQNAPCVVRTGIVHSSSASQGSTPRSLVSTANSVPRSSGFDVSTQTASKGLQIPLKVPVPKTSVAQTHPASDVTPAKASLAPPRAATQVTAHRLAAPVAQSRSFFGREKTPIPERALMCLTPGFGYVPLGEIHPTVTLDSPFKPGSSKSFLSVRQATEWLNSKLEAHLNTKMPPNLRWVVADGQTIEKKQQHRLSVDLLSSPNCTISTKGAIFS